MKGSAGSLVVAFMLAFLASLCLMAGMLDRQIAFAQRELTAQRYARADEALDSAERYLSFVGWIPWIRGGPLADIRVQRAAMRYWSGQYDRIVADRESDISSSSDRVDLQLIGANAVYRRGQPLAKDKRAALDALQAAASAYLAVLKNAPRNEAAAFNYEYVVRTREDIDKGRRAPELTDNAEDGPAGRKGGSPPPATPDTKDLKLLVPLEPGEIDKGEEPGKGGAIERKG